VSTASIKTGGKEKGTQRCCATSNQEKRGHDFGQVVTRRIVMKGKHGAKYAWFVSSKEKKKAPPSSPQTTATRWGGQELEGGNG